MKTYYLSDANRGGRKKTPSFSVGFFYEKVQYLAFELASSIMKKLLRLTVNITPVWR